MVKYQDRALDRTFAALADPTRRALLARLSKRDDISVSELAQPFAMSLPAEIEARVGGHYRVSFSTDDEYYEVGGIYREVVPNEKLVFSWAWHSTPERESLVTVTLKPDGDGTLLTLHHEQLFDQAARDGHERGWLGALDKLERFIA